MEESKRRHTMGAVVFFEQCPNGTYKKISATAPLPYFEALTYYAETPNPASQLVGGDSEKEVKEAITDIVGKMADIDWVEKYLTPYL